MIIAELLALLVLTGGSAFIIAAAVRQSVASRAREAKMQNDLRDALKSNDHRRLDDWLLLHTNHASKELKELVQQRRDQLYIESDR